MDGLGLTGTKKSLLSEIIGLASQHKIAGGLPREVSTFKRLNATIIEAHKNADHEVAKWQESHIFPLEMIRIREIKGIWYLFEIHVDSSKYRMLKVDAFEVDPENSLRRGLKCGEGMSNSPLYADWAIEKAISDFEQKHCTLRSKRERTVEALQSAFGIGPGGRMPVKNDPASKLQLDLVKRKGNLA
ncbi:MAG: hypothetical protein FWC09_00925 [Lachnospiraceae bacterium]|nr:hypothetical protein [Lachnospiraceae bacterium]